MDVADLKTWNSVYAEICKSVDKTVLTGEIFIQLHADIEMQDITGEVVLNYGRWIH